MAAQALVVPTIFTAVDKLSGVIQRMQRSVGGFAGRASIGVNALNRGLNRMLPSLGGIARQFLQMAQAAIIFGGIAFSFKTILDYEKSLAHLHGLLNTLTETGFKPYQKEIDRVAKATQYGAAAVADAFTKIAERNIALAKTPESLGAVTQAAITLSRAAKMELVPATDALVNILFQFGLHGKDANRVINVLSAGMVRGSSTIENQVEAYKKFAVTAQGANVTLEQSNALIQTVAHQVQGSDAGTALRNIILNLERYKQVYKNGKFDIGYALDKTADHLVKLGSEQKQNIFLQDLFGKRQVNVARQLLNNLPLYNRLTQEITGTNEAQRLSVKNTDNVTDAFKMLVAQYQNYITSNDNTLKGLSKLKNFIRYVTVNLDSIIDTIVTLIKTFLWLKGIIYLVRGALLIYNIAIGLTGALTGVANIAIGESGVALGTYRTALGLSTATQWLFNNSLKGMSFAGVATLATSISALGVAIYEIDQHWKSWGQTIAGMLGPMGALFAMAEGAKTSKRQNTVEGVGKQYMRSFGDVLNEYGNAISGTQGINWYFKALGSKGKDLPQHKWFNRDDESVKPALMTPSSYSQLMRERADASSQTKIFGDLGINITAPKGYSVDTTKTGNFNMVPKVGSTTGNK